MVVVFIESEHMYELQVFRAADWLLLHPGVYRAKIKRNKAVLNKFDIKQWNILYTYNS